MQSHLSISEKNMTKKSRDKSNGKLRLNFPHIKEDKGNAICLFYDNLLIARDDSGVLFYKQSEFISKCRHKSYYTVRKIK